MSQYFGDIKISNKGMIKLIRKDGRNYIFPASKIENYFAIESEEKPANIFIPTTKKSAAFFSFQLFCNSVSESSKNSEIKNESNLKRISKVLFKGLMETISPTVEIDPTTLCIVVDGEYLYVNQNYTIALEKRLERAIRYSNKVRTKKYGIFS